MLSILVYYMLFQFCYFYFFDIFVLHCFQCDLTDEGFGELDALLEFDWHFKFYFFCSFL